MFSSAKFRALYPGFCEFPLESDLMLIAEKAEMYLPRGCAKYREHLWMLMVAHMLTLRRAEIAGGGSAGRIASATVDKVSVSFAAPATSTSFSEWLGKTPHGVEYAALLRRCGPAIGYAAGHPMRFDRGRGW